MLVSCVACNRRFDAAGYRDAQCPSCGAVASPPEPRPCPSCDVPMRNREASDVEYGECGHCGGVFIDRVVIEHLLASYDDERVKVLLEALRTARYDADVVRVPTVRCPICGRRMDRKLSETGAGVIVDRCDAHGTYLDRGELQTLITFVQRDAARRIAENWPTPQLIVENADTEPDTERDNDGPGMALTAAVILTRILLGR